MHLFFNIISAIKSKGMRHTVHERLIWQLMFQESCWQCIQSPFGDVHGICWSFKSLGRDNEAPTTFLIPIANPQCLALVGAREDERVWLQRCCSRPLPPLCQWHGRRQSPTTQIHEETTRRKGQSQCRLCAQGSQTMSRVAWQVHPLSLKKFCHNDKLGHFSFPTASQEAYMGPWRQSVPCADISLWITCKRVLE